MVNGSCLCGNVRWQIDAALTGMTHCHCSMCRKSHGAPFATYAMVERDAVTWFSGSDQTGTWEVVARHGSRLLHRVRFGGAPRR